jgi:hypothetical protein
MREIKYIGRIGTFEGENLMRLENYPDYWITKDGRILSLLGKKPKYIKPFKVKGYLKYQLYDSDRKRIFKYAHTLVLETYVCLRPIGMEGCHNDGNKENNNVNNLRWDTRKANAQDSIKHGTQVKGERVTLSKLNDMAVKVLRYCYFKKGMSQPKLAKLYGMQSFPVGCCIMGRTWKHVKYGLGWKQIIKTSRKTTLTKKKINMIKTLRDIGFKQQRIADIFEVSYTTIHRVLNNKFEYKTAR